MGSISTRLEQYRNDIVQELSALVRIPSIKRAAQPGQPFGADIAAALEQSLALCEKLGLRTENFDGYAGHADAGEGEHTLGILVHLDVVPEGDGWSVPPYGGIVEDGRIWGRGTQDDKGPAIAAIYALRAVLDSGIALKRRVRIIFGCDEESGWECMHHYAQCVKMPDFGFAPDSAFPVCYAEKGLLGESLRASFDGGRSETVIEKLTGGTRPNVVPGKASAVLRCEQPSAVVQRLRAYIQEKGWAITVRLEEGKVCLQSEGRSAHASRPEAGVNAITPLILTLHELGLVAPAQKAALACLAERLASKTDGSLMGVACSDEPSGELTMNLGTIDMDDWHMDAVLNIRYPVTAQLDVLEAGMTAACAPYGVQVVQLSHSAPLYLPKDHPVVAGLMRVYVHCTGDTAAQPYSMGGGTYARAMENCVAFGIHFPDEPERAHQPDENIRIDSLMKGAEIMAEAIMELACRE